MTNAPMTAPAGARTAQAAASTASKWTGQTISWSAVFAGALAALGLSIVLVVLGSAFGFGAMSPFSDDGLSATTIGIVTIVWLILTQIFASVAGGYIAGRTRVRWSIHQDEVFFRDTVHGFLTWAVASGAMFGMAALAAGGGAFTATAVTSAAIESADGAPSPASLITDRLYRAPGADPETLAASREEAGRLIVSTIDDEFEMTPDDRNWLIEDVGERADIDRNAAEARVSTALSDITVAREEAREAVDTARAASTALAIATALAMMIGAFVACLGAVFGGRERDGLEDKHITA